MSDHVPGGISYQGWEPSKPNTPLDRIPPSISPSEFLKTYILPRKPCIFTSHLTDPSFHASRKWTDFAYLEAVAGHENVKVESLDPKSKAFGSALPRTEMTFGEFLKKMMEEKADVEEMYLTTQYEEQNASEDSSTLEPPFLCSPPCNSLTADLPLRPRLLHSLVPHQINLWLGRTFPPPKRPESESATSRSSGLHHDHHDNLYILLSGHKRFIIFPPSAHPHLHFHGTEDLQNIHPNGVISYEGMGDMGGDALCERDRWGWEVKRLERKVHELKRAKKDVVQKARLKGKWKGRAKNQASRDLRIAEDELAEAEDRLLDAIGEEGSLGGEVDDFDALGDLLDVDDPDLDDMDAGSIDDHGSMVSASSKASTSRDRKKPRSQGTEPPSFSRIPASYLHHKLGLLPKFHPIPTLPEDISEGDVDIPSLNPIVVHLEPGEMLYLPASWIHEVSSSSSSFSSKTSSSGSSSSAPKSKRSRGTKPDVHMALNYWFYPPDRLTPEDGQDGDEDGGVYQMQPLFDFLGKEVKRVWKESAGSADAQGEGVGSSEESKCRKFK
ncbi:hypothetical protein JAAARDRAFT_39516 [Jaapia argillacea MUCL 33604]|uniref:JmjC domain-containing protein n=1 Tax=Jaapia argillacea MUCL 33604 TaxID=933084 RepID=A0A067PH38_9AGAM|nr:hypothetical protein JAAARDRAFT_39516 [Jaapia argillacea MUCL 33604]